MDSKSLKREFSAQKVRKDYGRVAWFYNFWGSITESKATGWLLEHAGLTGSLQILDIGTGTGKMLKQIAVRNKDGENVGIDLSPDMLKRAEKKLSKTGCTYELQEGSAYNLPFEDNRFDRVFICFMIDLLPEKDFDILLKEFKRVLKNGGLLLVSYMTFGRSRTTRFWDWVAKKFPRLMTDCRPVNLPPYIQNAGFEIIKDAYIVQNTFPAGVVVAQKK